MFEWISAPSNASVAMQMMPIALDVAIKSVVILASAGLAVDQILAIEHPNTASHDEPATLGVAGVTAAGIGVVKTSTLTDNDGDSATSSATYNMTADIVIEDDGPIILIGLSGEDLDLGMDESIVNPRTTSDTGGSIAEGADDTSLWRARDFARATGSCGWGSVTCVAWARSV